MIMIDQRGDVVGHFVDWTRADVLAQVCAEGRVLKQRMAELLTDSFRALFLRMMGYKTDVIEFVSPEHTDKNVMIRAVKSDASASTTADAISEYAALKAFWHVTPYLEKLIAL